jgi:hypothetical protein|tara:strand:+ start:380 stop:1120 length:741 start_codon:yes stop_codon:yes gene_type:complete
MKWVKTKTMRFATIDEPLVEIAPPVPASQMIPEWFQKLNLDLAVLHAQPFPKMGDMLKDYNSHTVKKCPAVVDYFTQGYIIPMWYDLLVQRHGDSFHFESNSINTNSSHIEFHDFEQLPTYPFDEKDYKRAVKFTSPWFFFTPPGWSTLFIPPLLHKNDNFTVLPGIVETDSFHQVNFPSIWHSEGDILLKRGMPFLHAIPFKREKIGLDVTTFSEDDHKTINNESFRLRSKFTGGYRDITRRNKK